MIEDIKNFIRRQAKIDRSENSSGLGCSQIDLDKRIRVEEQGSNFISFLQVETQKGVGELVGPPVELLESILFIFTKKGCPRRNLMGRQGQDLAYIHIKLHAKAR